MTILFDAITEGLAKSGYSVHTDALPESLVSDLQALAHETRDEVFTKAAVGRGLGRSEEKTIRSDSILWIDNTTPAGASWLSWVESLQQYLNQHLFLGLFSFESHFAKYEEGDFYIKHSDAFAGESNRKLSLVTYLNDGWSSADGGELIIYDSEGNALRSILPERGTLVVFLSEDFPHEVLPAKKQRLSIAGWFHVNNSLGGRIDPPS